MKPINPRMEKVITAQLKAVFINATLALIISFGTVFSFWDFGLDNFIAAALIAFVLHKILNFVTLAFYQNKYYSGHFDEMVEDAGHAINIINAFDPSKVNEDPIQQLTLTIMETPEKIMGKYMGTEFYEWLDVKGEDGEPIRVTYTGTISLEDGEIPAPNSIIIPPGLVYQVEEV